MYEVLIAHLRECAKLDPSNNTYAEAADAIEKLRKIANKLLAKYEEEATSVILECSGNIDEDLDCMNKEVRTLMAQINGMPLHEPPKEVLTGTDMRGGIRRDDAGNMIDWGITGPPGEAGKAEEGE